jgi:hypothetical protein
MINYSLFLLTRQLFAQQKSGVFRYMYGMVVVTFYFRLPVFQN